MFQHCLNLTVPLNCRDPNERPTATELILHSFCSWEPDFDFKSHCEQVIDRRKLDIDESTIVFTDGPVHDHDLESLGDFDDDDDIEEMLRGF